MQPNVPAEVPLWLAISLFKQNKCEIQVPGWMNKPQLQGLLVSACAGVALFMTDPRHLPACRDPGERKECEQCFPEAALLLHRDLKAAVHRSPRGLWYR